MKSEDELKARVEELETEYRDGFEKTIEQSTENAKSLKEMIMIFLSKKR
jgi:hypothetical protein